VRKIEQKSIGISTLGGLDMYMDEEVGRLNKEKRGRFLGNFIGDDKILVVFKSGEYVLTNFETTNRYELKEILILEKFQPKKPLSVIHYYPSKKCYYVKRFLIETTTLDQKYSFIADETGAELTFVTLAKNPTS
jgi:topoisomerase-4 subunit A